MFISPKRKNVHTFIFFNLFFDQSSEITNNGTQVQINELYLPYANFYIQR
jgi:hypothetical protein